MRQAFGGLLWSKQFYHYDVGRWLQGDPTGPPSSPERMHGRNHEWRHLYNEDVISMPDKWEPTGDIEQSDGTSWMGMYCLNMLAMALELARQDPAYEDVASKFFEHFVYIAHAVHDLGDQGINLWDETDGFYYDVLHGDGAAHPLKVRSMVGLIPLFAVETLEPEVIDRLPGFKRRMQWFVDNHPEFREHVETATKPGVGVRRLLAIAGRSQLLRVLRFMLDEAEFLSPHGIRALSRYHQTHPYVLRMDGLEHRVDYEPAESSSSLFGGNSNWRGPSGSR
jgi:hypothetical protein